MLTLGSYFNKACPSVHVNLTALGLSTAATFNVRVNTACCLHHHDKLHPLPLTSTPPPHQRKTLTAGLSLPIPTRLSAGQSHRLSHH